MTQRMRGKLEWEMVSVKHMVHEGFISRIYKGLPQISKEREK